MKNVLMMYRWKHHSLMMETLGYLLKEKNIRTDILCIEDYSLFSNSSISWCRMTLLLGRIINIIRPYRVREKLKELYDAYVLSNEFAKYDLVNFHYHTYNNNPLMKGCMRRNTPFDLTLWGSDLNRINKDDVQKLEFGFDNCRKICVGSDSLYAKLNLLYMKKYEKKAYITRFGNSVLDCIDSLTKEEFSVLSQRLIGRKKNEIIITCGYNAKKEQQHLCMLKALESLGVEHKRNIHIVLPFTYEKDVSYNNEILSYIKRIGINYTILNRFLTTKELSTLRMETDIAINMQTTDSFSGSLQEHIYCGNILIVADWLDYPLLDKENVFYIKSSKENLSSTLNSVLNNFEKIKAQTQGNKSKIYKLSSWGSLIHKWEDVILT